MSRPAWVMVPEVCTSRPATMRSSVVLPQPEGPRKQISSPWCTPRLTSCSATTLPNSFLMCESSRNSTADLLLRLGLGRVPLVPLVEDLVAVLGGEGEVVLDEALLEVLRDVRQVRLDRRMRHDGEVLRIRLVRLLGHGPVHELLRRVHLLGRLHDARG